MSAQLGFLTPASLPSCSSMRQRAGRSPPYKCCAAVPPPTRGAWSARNATKRVVTVRAPVVDTRLEFASEAHHWITVSTGSVGMFERAAVAQADMVRRVERQVGSGAMHRWVLRAVEDPLSDGSAEPQSVNSQSTYVVMETYKHGDDGAQSGAMQRWLGAIERVGPALDSRVNATLQYANVFTAKMHDVSFDVDKSVVIVESVTANSDESAAALRETLESAAESSVSAGECQEFCVLQAANKPGFFKTLEVYKDIDALRKHMDSLDKSFVEKVKPLVAHSSHRARSAFKPVVFS